MKKIINSRMYNTEAAKCVGEWDNGCNHDDFNAIEESLYRKTTGEYFLFGWGGAKTMYARNTSSNSWASGSCIMPLELDEAQFWAEEKLSGEEYEKIFGEIVEDDSKVSTNLYLRKSCAEKLTRETSKQGLSKSAIVENLIDSI